MQPILASGPDLALFASLRLLLMIDLRVTRVRSVTSS